MKFQPDNLAGTNAVTRHERGAVWINGVRWAHSVLLPWRGDVRPWPIEGLAALTAGHFEQALALAPELVIFGSGERLQFVSPALYRCLIGARVGIETMDTAAACRTYNVLASEGRSVVAALLVPPNP
jgi:uncharacterized protein